MNSAAVSLSQMVKLSLIHISSFPLLSLATTVPTYVPYEQDIIYIHFNLHSSFNLDVETPIGLADTL